jgi:hypothetical protein
MYCLRGSHNRRYALFHLDRDFFNGDTALEAMHWSYCVSPNTLGIHASRKVNWERKGGSLDRVGPWRDAQDAIIYNRHPFPVTFLDVYSVSPYTTSSQVDVMLPLLALVESHSGLLRYSFSDIT